MFHLQRKYMLPSNIFDDQVYRLMYPNCTESIFFFYSSY
jgi:hypothetical protein